MNDSGQNPILSPILLDFVPNGIGCIFRKQKLRQNLECRMLIRDQTFDRKGKGRRIGQRGKLNSDADRVLADPAESSETNMLFRVLHQVKMTRPLYYHFSQSAQEITLRRIQLSAPKQILKEPTAVRFWLYFLQLSRKSSLKENLVAYLYIWHIKPLAIFSSGWSSLILVHLNMSSPLPGILFLLRNLWNFQALSVAHSLKPDYKLFMPLL